MVKSILVRWRAFSIWQKLGYLPWRKPKEKRVRKGGGDFYKGAFDSIPFLNDDAKRTFSHLLLRPGYMMRDYIRGAHERYLAPLTALIIFYAFFALVSAVLEPVQQHRELPGERLKERYGVDIHQEPDSLTVNGETDRILTNVVNLVRTGYLYLHLDQYPEEVDTQHESSIAALENTLRSQGIPLFVGQFFLLWMALAVALRKYKLGMSACAAISAYILCQFSFFMLFAVLLTWGESTSLGITLMAVLLTFDFCQLLGIGIKKSIRRVLSVGFHCVLWYMLVLVLVSLLVVILAYFKG